MRKIIIAISFVFICLFSNAQEKNQLNKMINTCLLSYLDWRSDFISKTSKDRVEYTPYICLDSYPNDFSFSEEVQKRNVKFMSLQNLSGQKKLKKGKEYEFIFMGMSLERNRMTITLSGKGVSIPKKNHLNIATLDWGIFIYEYSCDKQEWKLEETKFGGI